MTTTRRKNHPYNNGVKKKKKKKENARENPSNGMRQTNRQNPDGKVKKTREGIDFK